VAALGVAAGLAGFPICLAGIASLGLALGLRLPSPEALANPPPAVWLAALAIAPFLEEALYRERLLLALRGPLGPFAAVLVQGACFGALHGGHAWSLLGTFLVGLVLGAAALAKRSLILCVALHTGLNAGAWLLVRLLG
jgi:membrane protease YdiL (CAAX protease family)